MGIDDIQSDQIWILVVGFIVAFVLAFGIGANDVANTFGTSVGSKVLTLRQACILASIFEILGAVLLGTKVSETIRKGIIDVAPYENKTMELMLGNTASLCGCCVWMIAATLLRLPVSGTQSIIGATAGFAIVMHGTKGMRWDKVGMIIASWFISPVFAGSVSLGLFYFCKYFILNKDDPMEPGLRWLPIFYAVTLFVNLLSIFYDGPIMLGFHLIPLWGTFVISISLSILCAVIVRFCIVPWQRRRIKRFVTKQDNKYEELMDEEKTGPSPGISLIADSGLADDMDDSVSTTQSEKAIRVALREQQETEINCNEDTPFEVISGQESGETGDNLTLEDLKPDDDEILPAGGKRRLMSGIVSIEEDQVRGTRDQINDRPETARLFSFLQILTAVFGSFAHGGNDVSNSIGPLISLWLVATEGTAMGHHGTPIWILLYGGLGISIGLWIWGRKVIKTIGEDLTKVTPSSGFCIELGSAMTVLFASKVGVPISTTHCKVGSVVFVGRFRGNRNVNWSIFRNIVMAWVVTLPVTAAISAAIMAGFKLLL